MTTPSFNRDDFVYVDTADGSVTYRNHVKRVGVLTGSGRPERYASHNRATEALVAWVKTHRNEHDNPTVMGFDGPTWAPDLHLDFDREDDLEQAQTWLRETLDRLESWDVPLDALRIFFSGCKGFGVEAPETLFGGFDPAVDFHSRLKAAAAAILGDIPFDESVYDRLRLWRLEGSKHAKSGLYKVRLTIAEARTLSIEEIKEIARTPRDTSGIPELTPIDDSEWSSVPELVEIWQATALPQTAAPSVPSRAAGTRPSGQTLADEINDAGRHGNPDVPLGPEVTEFLIYGAQPGHQHTIALKAARALLASGMPPDRVVEKVFDALEGSPVGRANDPWKIETVREMVAYLVANPPPPLEDRPLKGRWKTMRGTTEPHAVSASVTAAPDPAATAGEHTNGTVSDSPPAAPGAPGTNGTGAEGRESESKAPEAAQTLVPALRQEEQREHSDDDEMRKEQPLDWLRDEATHGFLDLGVMLLDVRMTAGVEGRVELRFDPATPIGEVPKPHPMDSDVGLKVVNLGPAGDVLLFRKVDAALAQAFHRAIPLYKSEKWRKIGDTILRAAVVADVGISQEQETRGWLSVWTSQFPSDNPARQVNIKDGDELAPYIVTMKTMLARDAAYGPDDETYGGFFWGREGTRGKWRLIINSLTFTKFMTGPRYSVKITQREVIDRLRHLGFERKLLEAWVRDVDGKRGKKVKTWAWQAPSGLDFDA